jgi:hypothetical protein
LSGFISSKESGLLLVEKIGVFHVRLINDILTKQLKVVPISLNRRIIKNLALCVFLKKFTFVPNLIIAIPILSLKDISSSESS